MRASTRTNLSLWEWFFYVGYHPYFAAQVGLNVPQKTTPQCDDVMYQFRWQKSDNTAREDIAEAIAQAEDLIAAVTGFFTAPRYIQNERHHYPWTYDKRALTGFYQADGHLKSARVDYKRIQAIGIEQLTQVGNDESVTYTDTTGDGILDEFEVTATVPAGTAESEVAMFFTPADRNDAPLNDFEIRPLRVSISGTTATIKGHRAMMVKPDLTLVFDPDNLDVTVAGNFVTQVDVYRRTTDPSDAGTLIWENVHPSIYALWSTQNCVPPCQVEITTSCFGTRDMENGFVYPRPAQYDADTAQFTSVCPPQYRSPDRFTVNYLSGYPRQSNGWVDARLGRATAYLAASLLAKKKCGCDDVMQRLWELRNIPVNTDGNLEVGQAEIDKASRYFGSTTRGAVEASRLIQVDEGWQAVVF